MCHVIAISRHVLRLSDVNGLIRRLLPSGMTSNRYVTCHRLFRHVLPLSDVKATRCAFDYGETHIEWNWALPYDRYSQLFRCLILMRRAAPFATAGRTAVTGLSLPPRSHRTVPPSGEGASSLCATSSLPPGKTNWNLSEVFGGTLVFEVRSGASVVCATV